MNHGIQVGKAVVAEAYERVCAAVGFFQVRLTAQALVFIYYTH